MLDTRIILTGLWVATMLTNLWGDVLRSLASHEEPGGIFSAEPTQGMWLFMAAIMMIPIVMVVLTLMLPYPAIRWANIIVAIFWVVFAFLGFSGYTAYNKFTQIMSAVFSAMTVWYAWRWV